MQRFLGRISPVFLLVKDDEQQFPRRNAQSYPAGQCPLIGITQRTNCNGKGEHEGH